MKSKTILFDINHPAHVHFFKNVISLLKERNYNVVVTSTKKDINEELLEKYNIDFIGLGKYRSGFILKFIDFISVAIKFLFIVRKLKPDVILSIFSGRPFGTLVSNAKFYVFHDTEHAKEHIALYKPFATKIYTPYCFNKELGKKQIKYNGFHELAYLHSNRFKPNPKVLEEIGVLESETFFILRFVSWDATHDIGQKGISLENKRKLIDILKPVGKIIITSENELPKEFEEYRMSVCPTKMHDLLYYASLFIGEGATMASECAMLGTQAVYVNSLDAGTLQEQERLGLIYNLRNDEKLIELVDKILTQNLIDKTKSRELAKKVLSDKIDVTQFMLKVIEES